VMGWESKNNFAGLYGQFLQSANDAILGITGEQPSYKTISSTIRVVEQLTGIPDWPVKVTGRLWEDLYIDGGKFDNQSVKQALFGRVAD